MAAVITDTVVQFPHGHAEPPTDLHAHVCVGCGLTVLSAEEAAEHRGAHNCPSGGENFAVMHYELAMAPLRPVA